MKVDIYDFDKTLIPFDSGSLFWGYCILHYPWILICLPYQIIGFILYGVGIYNLKAMKKPFFSFIKLIPLERAVRKFWDRHEKEVYAWAAKDQRENYSVVISASPDFVLDEIMKRLDFDDYICTKHDKHGAVIGYNCHDNAKVVLFREKYPDAEVVNVYSDSIANDVYIFSLGQNCYHINTGKRYKFNFEDRYPSFKR